MLCLCTRVFVGLSLVCAEQKAKHGNNLRSGVYCAAVCLAFDFPLIYLVCMRACRAHGSGLMTVCLPLCAGLRVCLLVAVLFLFVCVHPHASLSWPPSQRRRCIFQQKSLAASGLVRLVMSKWRTARYVRVPLAPLPPSLPRFCVANMAFMQFCLNCISVIFLLRAWHVARLVARNGREQFRRLAHKWPHIISRLIDRVSLANLQPNFVYL